MRFIKIVPYVIFCDFFIVLLVQLQMGFWQRLIGLIIIPSINEHLEQPELLPVLSMSISIKQLDIIL